MPLTPMANAWNACQKWLYSFFILCFATFVDVVAAVWLFLNDWIFNAFGYLNWSILWKKYYKKFLDLCTLVNTKFVRTRTCLRLEQFKLLVQKYIRFYWFQSVCIMYVYMLLDGIKHCDRMIFRTCSQTHCTPKYLRAQLTKSISGKKNYSMIKFGHA